MATSGRLTQVKQGLRQHLPTLKIGELGFATDDFTFWIGSSDGNKQISMEEGSTTVIGDGTVSFDKLDEALQEKINALQVINNLTSTSETNPVSANQARLLKEDVDAHKKKDASLTEKGHVYHGVVSATIGTTWQGAQAPYTQVVTVNGIKEGDSPFVTVDYNQDVVTATSERNAYYLIDSAVTGENYIEFRCFEEAPTIPLNIQIKVVR